MADPELRLGTALIFAILSIALLMGPWWLASYLPAELISVQGGNSFSLSPDMDGSACWMALANRPGCYIWYPILQTDAPVTWIGGYSGGFAQGRDAHGVFFR